MSERFQHRAARGGPPCGRPVPKLTSQPLSGPCAGPPTLGPLLDPAKGKRPFGEHHVVECPHIETVSETSLGPRAELSKLQLSDLVHQRLPRPDDVSVDLDRNSRIAHPGVLPEELDRPLPVPSERVEAGIDHESDRPPHVEGELAHFGVRVPIKSELLSQTFRVESPAFYERGRPALARNGGRWSSSCARAIWRWCPGTASWSVRASISQRGRTPTWYVFA